jgi:hypothetical protein
VAIPAKAAKFALKYVHRIEAVMRFVAKYDKIPDTVKELAFSLILPEVWAGLVEDAGAVQTLGAGTKLSKAQFYRLLRGERTDMAKIYRATWRPNHVDGDKVKWVYKWKDAEALLIDDLMLGKGKKGKPQLYFKNGLRVGGGPSHHSRPGGRSIAVSVTDPPPVAWPKEVFAGAATGGLGCAYNATASTCTGCAPRSRPGLIWWGSLICEPWQARLCVRVGRYRTAVCCVAPTRRAR